MNHVHRYMKTCICVHVMRFMTAPQGTSPIHNNTERAKILTTSENSFQVFDKRNNINFRNKTMKQLVKGEGGRGKSQDGGVAN